MDTAKTMEVFSWQPDVDFDVERTEIAPHQLAICHAVQEIARRGLISFRFRQLIGLKRDS